MNAGARLGPYEIVDKLGEGGMGEVYLADDTRLGRKVAIKVLPAEFAGDSERRSRFEQEARAAAALNHPGIATIHDVGVEGEGDEATHYMVQEFLEGETLEDHLGRGALPRKKALTLGAEIASALAVAHQAGIVHRDLKPANIFVTPAGNAKVLDFGLAKLTEMSAVAASGDRSMSPTVVGTMAGTIMGTAGYMAPEQIGGEAVDQRADVFALGCVLYELLGGRRAFTGKSLPDTLAKILHEDPESLSGLGPALERVLQKCLAKDPIDRYQHADDLAVDLRYLATAGEPVDVAMEAATGDAAGVSWLMVAAVAAVALALGGYGSTWLTDETDTAGGPLLDLPTQVTHFSTAVQDPSISPNGQMVTFIARDPTDGWGQVYVKSLPDGPPLRLTSTPRHKDEPAFSPDGSRIAFTTVGEGWEWDTWTVSLNGGEPRLMLRNGNALQWTRDGQVLFSQFKEGAHLGIVRADASGANQREIWFPPRPWQMAHFSDISGDGSRIAIGYMGAEKGRPSRCFVTELPVPEGEPPTIGEGPGCRMRVRFGAADEWVYYEAPGQEIWRSPAAGGRAERIVPRYPGMEDLAGFTLTPDGRSLLYAAGTSRRHVWLRRADGTTSQLSFEDDSWDPVFSADGQFVFYRREGSGSTPSLWRYRLVDGSREEVCLGLDVQGMAVARDGNRILVRVRGDDGLQDAVLCHVDGSEPPRSIFDEVPSFAPNIVFSPDGDAVYLATNTESGQNRILKIDVISGERTTLAQIGEFGSVEDVSPDGRWLSISQGFASSSGWLYSTEGDAAPRHVVDGWTFEWSPGGASFLFLNDGMVSSAWELPNPDGLLAPEGMPISLETDWLRSAGAVQLMSTIGFSHASPSPRPFEAVYTLVDRRTNLFQVALPE